MSFYVRNFSILRSLLEVNLFWKEVLVDNVVTNDISENAFSGDDISATCFHSFFRKLVDIPEVAALEKQWMEEVYLSAEKISGNKQLSLANRLAFAVSK